MSIRYYVILFLLTTTVLSSCVNYRKNFSREDYEGKYLLHHQKIKGNKEISTYELEEIIPDKPNRSLITPAFGKPYLGVYLIGKKKRAYGFIPGYNPEKLKEKFIKVTKKYDCKVDKDSTNEKRVSKISKKKKKKLDKIAIKITEGNGLMRTVGEKPVFIDSLNIAYVKEQITLYYHSKGYFKVDVEPEIKELHKNSVKTKLVYNIDENRPHVIGLLEYDIEDPVLEDLVLTSLSKSHLKKGKNFNVSDLTNERVRITRLLKNLGYFKITRQSISFEVDTLANPFIADIKIILDNPEEGTLHQRYKLSNVLFRVDVAKSAVPDTIVYKSDESDSVGVTYIIGGDKVSVKLLHSKLRILPGDYYSYSKSEKTQILIGGINSFKFVNINYIEKGNNELTAIINTSSSKKYSITTETGVNVNVSNGRGLPGPFASVSFKDKKLFNGYEILEANIRYSLEVQPSILDQQESFRIREVGGNLQLSIPKLLLPLKLRYKLEDYSNRTRFILGYSDVDRFEFDRTNATVAMNYEWQMTKSKKFNVSIFDLNVVNTTNIDESFLNYLNGLSESYKQSFEPSIISTLNASYIYNNNNLTSNKKANFMKLFVEGGGIVPGIVRQLSKSTESNTLFSLPYFQFMKFSSDFRTYKPINEFGNVAIRFNGGIAKPYGSSEILPYEKFFFIGGLNSIRAWAPRRLGPGSYAVRDEDGDIVYNVEQPGELILESSIEFRTKIVGFIHGAAFVDAGNVWSVSAADNREGADFKIDRFYKEIAVGTGVGLRLDFSFLIFRFDVGFKVYDPARAGLVPLNDKYSRAYNIGLGHPF